MGKTSSRYLEQYPNESRKAPVTEETKQETEDATGGRPYYLKDKIWDEAVQNAHRRGEGRDLTTSRWGRGSCSGEGIRPIWEMEGYLGRPLRDSDFQDGVMEPSNIRDLQEHSQFKDVHRKRNIWE